MTAPAISIVLADDHQIVRRGICDFLREAGLDVVGEAKDGLEAIKMIHELQPDVAILDIQMPELSGLQVVKQVRKADLNVGLLLLTAFDDDPYLAAALEYGVNGYVLKTTDAEDIIQAVYDVHEGKTVLTADMLRRAAQALASDTSHTADGLTAREVEVLVEVSKGLTNKTIAYQLGISDRTVQSHMRRIYEKLNVSNRTEAVVRASQLGVLELPYDDL